MLGATTGHGGPLHRLGRRSALSSWSARARQSAAIFSSWLLILMSARGVYQLIAFLGLRPAKFGSRHLRLSIRAALCSYRLDNQPRQVSSLANGAATTPGRSVQGEWTMWSRPPFIMVRLNGERRSGPSAEARRVRVFTFVQAHYAKNELDFRVPFTAARRLGPKAKATGARLLPRVTCGPHEIRFPSRCVRAVHWYV